MYPTSYDIGWSLHVHIFSGILLHGTETCHLFIIAHSLVLREHSHQEKAVTSEFRWSCHLGSRQYGWFEWRVESQLVHCSGSYSLLFNHQMSILFLVLAFNVRVLRSPLLSQPAVLVWQAFMNRNIFLCMLGHHTGNLFLSLSGIKVIPWLLPCVRLMLLARAHRQFGLMIWLLSPFYDSVLRLCFTAAILSYAVRGAQCKTSKLL